LDSNYTHLKKEREREREGAILTSLSSNEIMNRGAVQNRKGKMGKEGNGRKAGVNKERCECSILVLSLFWLIRKMSKEEEFLFRR
jgi:hypothetical protein